MTREELNNFIKSVTSLRSSATDQAASLALGAYPSLHSNNALVPVGTRVNWNGKLMKAVNDLWDTPENNPDNAPDLWVQIMYKEGIRIIPEKIDMKSQFAQDELGWWKDHVYKSKLIGNVYTPDEYADGWEFVR